MGNLSGAPRIQLAHTAGKSGRPASPLVSDTGRGCCVIQRKPASSGTTDQHAVWEWLPACQFLASTNLCQQPSKHSPYLCPVCAPSNRQEPRFIPASTLGQIHRWATVLVAQLFRGAVDLGRPADISLYHLGCFKLVLPDGSWVYLAALVLSSLQQQQQSSISELLGTFRAAGAVLHISAPKCKQCQRKRSKNGDQCIDWLPLRKHLLPPELSLLCPTRTLAFCMAVMWWSKGSVTARLLTLRTASSTGKAAPKRHEQADYQGVVPSGSWRVPSSFHSRNSKNSSKP